VTLINQTLPFFFGIGGISRPIKIAIKIPPGGSALSRLLAWLYRNNGVFRGKKQRNNRFPRNDRRSLDARDAAVCDRKEAGICRCAFLEISKLSRANEVLTTRIDKTRETKGARSARDADCTRVSPSGKFRDQSRPRRISPDDTSFHSPRRGEITSRPAIMYTTPEHSGRLLLAAKIRGRISNPSPETSIGRRTESGGKFKG